ncbi:MAG: hypothetical protein JSS49_18370 [Planctomycetes bacterium]|nr:hypothetical protein [Planctomycetota bacterium]
MPQDPKPLSLREIVGMVTLQQESLLFVVVSAMDVFMTYILLSKEGSVFMESNPVARYFIAEWGPRGMVYFKFSMVAFVCVLAQIIARQKPLYARWLLQGATALVAVVVVYSLTLLLKHGNPMEVEL